MVSNTFSWFNLYEHSLYKVWNYIYIVNDSFLVWKLLVLFNQYDQNSQSYVIEL